MKVTELDLNRPVLPRIRRAPTRINDGAHPVRFKSPKQMFETLELTFKGDNTAFELLWIKVSWHKRSSDWRALSSTKAMLPDGIAARLH